MQSSKNQLFGKNLSQCLFVTMAVKASYFVLALVIIFSSWNSVLGKNRNYLNLKLELLVNRLTNNYSKGIEKCIVFADFPESNNIVDQLQAKLSRSLQVMLIKLAKNLNLNNYRKPVISKIPRYYSVSREVRGILNQAGGSTILICIFNERNPRYLIKKIREIYRNLAQPENIPKVLLISLADRAQARYRTAFKFFNKSVYNITDVEIVEISSSASRRKRNNNRVLKRRRTSHDFVVHQYNPFTMIYKKQKLSRRVKFFQPKTANLHGHSLLINKNYERRRVNKTFLGENSNLMTFLRGTMNFTFKDDLYTAGVDLLLCERQIASYEANAAFLKPNQLQTVFLCTPVILDDFVELNLMDFVKFFPLIFLFAFLLKLCGKYSEFNPHTWSEIETFKMLLGLDNPTGLTKSLFESTLFIFVSFTGFFFSNELSEAATNILNPFQIERQFKTYSDLTESNITVGLPDFPSRNSIYGIPCENPIFTSKVRYLAGRATFDDYLQMLICRNMSVYQYECCLMDDFFPKGIVINGQTLARRADLTVSKDVVSIIVSRFSPYLERMSDLYWRFYESGFRHTMKVKEALRKQTDIRRFIEYKYYYLTQCHEHDDSDRVISEISYVLHGILIIGSTSALSLLIAELFYKKLLNDANELYHNTRT